MRVGVCEKYSEYKKEPVYYMLGKIKCDVISVGERQDFMVSWSGS